MVLFWSFSPFGHETNVNLLSLLKNDVYGLYQLLVVMFMEHIYGYNNFFLKQQININIR